MNHARQIPYMEDAVGSHPKHEVSGLIERWP